MGVDLPDNFFFFFGGGGGGVYKLILMLSQIKVFFSHSFETRPGRLGTGTGSG